MQWKIWSEKAQKPATIMVTGLIGVILCMITDSTSVIMPVPVALFTAGVTGLMTDQHKQRSNQ